jgi:hypothetical protein
MRYGKLSLVFVAMFLCIFWIAQADAKGGKVVIPAPVPQTGQAGAYYPGDDGDLQMGVPWPDPRFNDLETGTVLDNLTGLVWTKNANLYGIKPWCYAIQSCDSCNEGGKTDWRLPNVRELQSLIDYGGEQYSMVPAGHPFVGIGISGTFFYWSSSTHGSGAAWVVSFENGHMHTQPTNCSPSDPTGYLVWCVRGGQYYHDFYRPRHGHK